MGDQKCPVSASVEPDFGRGRLQHRGDPRNARLSWIGRLAFCHPDNQASDGSAKIDRERHQRAKAGGGAGETELRPQGRRALEGASWRVAPVVGDGLSRDVLARSILHAETSGSRSMHRDRSALGSRPRGGCRRQRDGLGKGHCLSAPLQKRVTIFGSSFAPSSP